ncbi:MAG: hypothetical protein ACYCWW_16600 [Deltaproteobacteria bacterium]
MSKHSGALSRAGAVAAAAMMASCAQLVPMVRTSHGVIASNPLALGSARVTFSVADERSFGFGDPSDTFYIVDEAGHLLGALLWGSSFSVELPAGNHEFFEWDPWKPVFGRPVDAAMTFSFQAGKSYFIELTTKPRSLFQSAVIAHFTAPATTPEGDIDSLSPLIADPQAIASWEARHHDSIKQHLDADRERLRSSKL